MHISAHVVSYSYIIMVTASTVIPRKPIFTAIMTGHRYFLLNKPYNMVSQFVSKEQVRLLGDIDFPWPEGTHAIGRLDNLSEGLLLLTTDKRVTKLLFMGATRHRRTYLVRVKDAVTPVALQQLRTGVDIVVDAGATYRTPPCEVELLTAPPPIVLPHQQELRPQVPHSWLRISLYEGKFHQVRKMVNAVGHPCRRLIRESIEGLELGELQPGCVQEISGVEFFGKLGIVV